MRTTVPWVVGGQFELDRDAVSRLAPVAPPPGIWPSTARAALVLVEEALARSAPGRPVLLPAYACDAVVQPFRAAGRPVAFYGVDRRLRLDHRELRRLVDALAPAAVVVLHYFGVPLDETAELVEALRPRVRVVEDCAQGGLLEPGSREARSGDYVVTSLRKYLPVPDGALLLDRVGDVDPGLLGSGEAALSVERLAAQALRHDVLAGRRPAHEERAYLIRFEHAERALDAEIPLAPMSGVSAALLARLDLAAARERRRVNHAQLAARLEDGAPELARLLPDELPLTASPLVLPVEVPRGRRDALRAALAGRRVFCPVHWPTPRDVPGEAFAQAAALSRSILGLPLDQRYGPDAIAYVADAVADAWREVA